MNIVITGASSGVGFEAVLELIYSNENKVVALARSEDKLTRLHEIALALNPEATLYTAKFDIVKDDHEIALIPFLKERLGTVDILINNAGVLINKPFELQSQFDFLEMMQYNFMGHVKMIQNLLPFMNENSHIVNIGSMGGYAGSVKFPGCRLIQLAKVRFIR